LKRAACIFSFYTNYNIFPVSFLEKCWYESRTHNIIIIQCLYAFTSCGLAAGYLTTRSEAKVKTNKLSSWWRILRCVCKECMAQCAYNCWCVYGYYTRILVESKSLILSHCKISINHHLGFCIKRNAYIVTHG